MWNYFINIWTFKSGVKRLVATTFKQEKDLEMDLENFEIDIFVEFFKHKP
jgi:hypothetical protein